MNFLFWNIVKKNLVNEIVNLVTEYNIDVLMLAECEAESNTIIVNLNKINLNLHWYALDFGLCKKIKFFTNIDKAQVKRVHENERTIAVSIKGISLIITHYISKLHYSDSDQNAEVPVLKAFIDYVEKQEQHKKTIVCGDFNMNPFQDAMIQTFGLNSVMEKSIAKTIKRTVQYKEYFYFYNPMWSFYGDLGKGEVSGTYYLNASKPINYHWNIFDQILMRPELIDVFDDNYLDIITKTKNISFLTKNAKINESKYSDHLPIKFSFKI